MAVGLLKGLHCMGKLVGGFSGERGTQLLQLSTVVDVVVQHIGQQCQDLVPLKGSVVVGVLVMMVMGMVVGMVVGMVMVMGVLVMMVMGMVVGAALMLVKVFVVHEKAPFCRKTQIDIFLTYHCHIIN